MKLLPAGAEEGSDWEDGLWVEGPGYPSYDGSWVHPPPSGLAVPEFEFEEGDERTKNEPPPVFYVGTGDDCHVRLLGDSLPERICKVFKEGRVWLLEGLLPDGRVHHGSRQLFSGDRVTLSDSDSFSVARPPTPLGWRVCIRGEDNWYIDHQDDREFPNKYPGRFPCRSSLQSAPPAPEELRRLAWQTDQMRRRSEEDQVRVADWSAFSQYVKRHYYQHGIECTPWCITGRGTPVDKKPPSFPPRAYPSWIAQLVQREEQLPGIDASRQMPFESSLQVAGLPPPARRGLAASGHALQGVSSPPAPPSGAGTAATIGAGAGIGAASGAASGSGARLQSFSAPLRAAPAAAAAAAAAGAAAAETPQKVNPHLRRPFREWLEGMDESLFLLQYHDQIAATFDSLEQIHEIYFKGGEIGKAFFEDTGIKKLGHRRIFEKWFRDHCR